MFNNIYKSNLDIIINWKEGELIKKKEYNNNLNNNLNDKEIDKNNNNDNDNNNTDMLEIDGCYFNFFKNVVPDFDDIIEIFNKSFNHHLILISISSNINNIDDNYNKLNNEEYIANMINYLEQSLEGLYRFKEFNKKINEYDKLNLLYNNCCSQLDLIKNNNIIHSFYENNQLDEDLNLVYNNENELFTELYYEDIDFENSNNNIITYIYNILSNFFYDIKEQIYRFIYM